MFRVVAQGHAIIAASLEMRGAGLLDGSVRIKVASAHERLPSACRERNAEKDECAKVCVSDHVGHRARYGMHWRQRR